MPAMKKLKLRNEYEITWPFISPLPEGEGARCLSYLMRIPKHLSPKGSSGNYFDLEPFALILLISFAR